MSQVNGAAVGDCAPADARLRTQADHALPADADTGDAALDEAAPQSTQDLTLFVRRFHPPALLAAPAIVFVG